MSLSAALHATVGTLRRRPGDLLPAYGLGAAVLTIARVLTVAGVATALVYLFATGRLGPLVAGLAGRNLTPPDPQANPQAFSAWVEGLRPVLAPALTPAVLGTVLLALLLTAIAAVVLAAAATAAQLSACHARLRDRRGTVAAIDGLRRHWVAFLGAYLLEALIWAVGTAVAAGATLLAAAVSPLLGVAVGIVAVLAWLAVVVPTRAVFAFVPVAIVVDDVGLWRAIRAAAGFIRREPVDAVGYYVLALGVVLAVSAVAAVLSLVNATAAVTPVAVLAVAPGLDLLKTGLFGQYRGAFDPPDAPVGSIRGQTVAGCRRGLRQVGGFVRHHPGLNAVAAVLLVGGFAVGWYGAAPFVGALQTSIVGRLADRVPPASTFEYFGNNAGVALSMAYSGLALAVPAAVTLWLNGLILGVYAHLEVAPAVMAAFVLPHGIFELPALVVAGAVGLHLGGAWWRTWRGGASRVDLADAMEAAFWVLVGVGVLLAVAAILEGFVSPYYWRLFL